jgi:hypothetical protein
MAHAQALPPPSQPRSQMLDPRRRKDQQHRVDRQPVARHGPGGDVEHAVEDDEGEEECGMWNVECGMWNVECGMWNVECATVRPAVLGTDDVLWLLTSGSCEKCSHPRQLGQQVAIDARPGSLSGPDQRGGCGDGSTGCVGGGQKDLGPPRDLRRGATVSQIKNRASRSGIEASAGFSGQREQPAKASNPEDYLNIYRGRIIVLLRSHPRVIEPSAPQDSAPARKSSARARHSVAQEG